MCSVRDRILTVPTLRLFPFLSTVRFGTSRDGEQTRDFVSVKDIAAANAFAAENLALEGVYNVGYGQQLTINELARRILQETGSSSQIRHEEPRSGDVRHSLASVEKLARAGFEPRGSLEQGLRDTLAWYQAQSS